VPNFTIEGWPVRYYVKRRRGAARTGGCMGKPLFTSLDVDGWRLAIERSRTLNTNHGHSFGIRWALPTLAFAAVAHQFRGATYPRNMLRGSAYAG